MGNYSEATTTTNTLSNKKLAAVDEQHLIINLTLHKEKKGGIQWATVQNQNCDKAQKQLINKVNSLIDKHTYKKELYPLTIENLIRESSTTLKLVNNISKTLPRKTIFTKRNQFKLQYSLTQKLELSFRLQKKGNTYKFSQLLQYQNIKLTPDFDTFKDLGIITDDKQVYFWKEEKDMHWFIKTKELDGKIIEPKNIQETFEHSIKPLARNYILHIDSQLIGEYIKKKKPKPILSITNENNKIYFQMLFLYEGVEVKPPVLNRYYVFEDSGLIAQVDRDKEEELHWLNEVIALHSDFQIIDNFKWSIASKKFSKSWCKSFFETLEEWGIQIKNNNVVVTETKTYTPNIQIKFLQNTNWFDAIIDVRVDNKAVPIQEIQDAILENSQEIYINGDPYILSKDWLKKYRNIFMWGKVNKNKLRFSHYQDYLFTFLNNAKIGIEKNKKSSEINKNATLPKNLLGKLRGYQKEGFQWINVLQQTGKGGILADDMGLGKTIQTLTQLLKFFETYSKLTSIIICPASLINNWTEEITKFAPDLKYFVYHSQERELSSEHIAKYQVIITSYNILQKDIKILKNINFDYIILDESQYIKNPHSKTARCVFNLSGKHRLCLSGTPLQNHTFDIYSQIHFLNPNILGSIENFKNRFAVLIDQYEEKETRNELRQLLDPFVLRRTKKQVAKDLPDKTESIVYCKMEETQQEIYEYYRERHRNYLIQKIEKEGLRKSRFHVLQGLTFLRQICNSPLLVKEGIAYNEVPIKLKILKERLITKESDNKALIFSQFIGMLGLIEKQIKEDKWNYAYFDGKTPLEKRTNEIKRFQEDVDCKLFLISIKAGNVGLNLTAADYVYLIDPWWNPAIEQQAIDRTHRIGQKKNIFSSKFICTDTIEEKIVLLQKKKSDLADNLILLNNNSLIKNLDSQDIEYLFGN